MMIGRVISIVLGIALLSVVLKKWIFVILGILLGLWLARKFADLYWKGKDKTWW